MHTYAPPYSAFLQVSSCLYACYVTTAPAHQGAGTCSLHLLLQAWFGSQCGCFAGKQQEDMARAAGFTRAVHYELAFGLMGVLVLQK